MECEAVMKKKYNNKISKLIHFIADDLNESFNAKDELDAKIFITEDELHSLQFLIKLSTLIDKEFNTLSKVADMLETKAGTVKMLSSTTKKRFRLSTLLNLIEDIKVFSDSVLIDDSDGGDENE